MDGMKGKKHINIHFNVEATIANIDHNIFAIYLQKGGIIVSAEYRRVCPSYIP